MVMRDQLDAALVRAARATGVMVRENERVLAVFEDSDGITVTTARGSYRGRVLIGADGANSLVARTLFREKRLPCMTGMEGEARVLERPVILNAGTIVLDIGIIRGGYAWVFPKKRNLSIGVAGFQEGGVVAKEGYERFLREEASLTGLPRPPSRGHPLPVYRGSSSEGARLTAGRALLVGDAAHLVDPLFGEGIYYAVLSGQLGAKSIKDHLDGQTPDLSTYADRVAAQIYPEFRVAGRIAWVLYTFPRVFHRIVRRRPDIIQLFYDVLKGVETYQSFYAKAKGHAADSLVTVLKSW